MNKQILCTLFLFISPFILWAQENVSPVAVTKASGTAFSIARENNLVEYSSNLVEIKDLQLHPGDIITTNEKTSLEISINQKTGRIKLGENTSLIFVQSAVGESSAFILTKGIIKVQNKKDIPGNSIFVRTETLSAEIIRGEAGLWLHPKRQGSIDTKTEVFCLNGKSDIFVLKKTPDNSWYDKDPEYNEHFLQTGNVLSVRSDQAPLAVEEAMTQPQKQWWENFDFGKDLKITEKATPEESKGKEDPNEETKEVAKEVEEEQEATPPEEEVLDEEVAESSENHYGKKCKEPELLLWQEALQCY